MFDERILIAGSGGQGIMFLGKTLARAAARENKYTTWIPSYGAEMRGGTAHCFVRISSQRIASPVFENPTSAIILNQLSCDKFASGLKKTGILIVDTTLGSEVKKTGAVIKKVPLNAWALKIGNIKVLNVIALGVFLKYKDILRKSTVEEILGEQFMNNKEVLKQNLKAFQWGVENG